MTVNQYSMLLNDEKLPYLYKEAEHDIQSNDLSSPEYVAKMACDLYHADKLPFEEAWVFSMNTRNKLIATFKIARGSIDAAALSTREIMLQLLLSNAAAFVLVHNHPSGDCEPSSEDISFSRTLRDAGKLLNIRMQDSVIVGENGNYMSLKERGLI